MKKGCLIAFGVLVALVLLVMSVSIFITNKKIGYLEAKPISHETVAPPFTRFRLAVNPEKLSDYVENILGANVDSLPSWLPLSPNEIAHKLMPYEFALMTSADYESDQVNVRVFLNERRGGPMMPEVVRQQKILEQFPSVKWDAEGLRFERRGVLTADGVIVIPAGLESWIRMDWDVEAGNEALKLEGGHLAEAVLDNRNGEAALLLGTILDQKQRMGWKQHFETSNLKILMEILRDVTEVRLSADLASIDAIRLKLRIDAYPDAGPSFNNFSTLEPLMADGIMEQYGLKLEGSGEWDEQESAYIGNYRLSGLSKFIDQTQTEVE